MHVFTLRNQQRNNLSKIFFAWKCEKKYDKQDRQGKAAFNERRPHPTQQQAPSARSPGAPQLNCLCSSYLILNLILNEAGKITRTLIVMTACLFVHPVTWVCKLYDIYFRFSILTFWRYICIYEYNVKDSDN
jgi:hypothetical protein